MRDSFLDSLHYDNPPAKDPDGHEVIYDNKRHVLNSPQYQHHEEKRKKTAIDSKHTGLLGYRSKQQRNIFLWQKKSPAWIIPPITKSGNPP